MLSNDHARLIEAVERRPQAAFAAFLALHGVVWTALPALLFHNLPLDVIEAMTYGREWQIGYDKLPPLPWWLAEIVWRAVRHRRLAICAVPRGGAYRLRRIWATARPLVGATGALAARLIIDGMHYFNFSAVKFNHNVIELPFWALAGFAFHAGLRRGRLRYWILLGVALGSPCGPNISSPCWRAAGAVFAPRPGRAPAFGHARSVARRRRRARREAPHLVWLVQHDSQPLITPSRARSRRAA